MGEMGMVGGYSGYKLGIMEDNRGLIIVKKSPLNW